MGLEASTPGKVERGPPGRRKLAWNTYALVCEEWRTGWSAVLDDSWGSQLPHLQVRVGRELGALEIRGKMVCYISLVSPGTITG